MLVPKNIRPGEEQYEYYKDRVSIKRRCAYDYRDNDGTLFSCIRLTLEDCRRARDAWLDKK
jgi:hypothetical protein